MNTPVKSRTVKTMRVTITKLVHLQIDDASLTPEALAEFSASIYQVSKPLEIFECAAQQIARFEPSFVEGVGRALPAAWPASKKDEAAILWNELDEEVEVEEVTP